MTAFIVRSQECDCLADAVLGLVSHCKNFGQVAVESLLDNEVLLHGVELGLVHDGGREEQGDVLDLFLLDQERQGQFTG